jgi:hypothetical protein
MSYLLVAVSAALLGGEPAAPELVNVHPTYGYLGAPRPKGPGMLPGDVGHFSFDIKNLKADKNGKVAYSIAIVITDAAGKVVFEQKPYKAVAQHFFGGDTIPGAARVAVPLDAKPGPLSWKVTITDRTTNKSTELTGKGAILPPEFGLIQVGTFADAEERVPMPPVGTVGSHLFVSFAVTGFTRGSDKQPDIKVSLRIVDEKGKPTIANPLTGHVKDLSAGERVVPMQFGLSLDRVGRYTVELSAQDALTGKTASVSFPVRILPAD